MGVKEQEILTTDQLLQGGRKSFTSELAVSINPHGIKVSGELLLGQFKVIKRKAPPESIAVFREAVAAQHPDKILAYLTTLLGKAAERIKDSQNIDPTFAYLRDNPELLYALLSPHEHEAASLLQTFRPDDPEPLKAYKLSTFLEIADSMWGVEEKGVLTLFHAEELISHANTRNMSDFIPLSFFSPKITPSRKDHEAMEGHTLATFKRWENVITSERFAPPELHREVTKGFTGIYKHMRSVMDIDNPNLGDIRRLSFQDIVGNTGPLHTAFLLYTFHGDDRLKDLVPVAVQS